MDLPWTQFVAVQRGKALDTAPAIDPKSVKELGLVLSQSDYSGEPNVNNSPGSFTLQVGI